MPSIRRVAAALACLGLLAACQTPCPAPDNEPVTHTFRCEDGSDLVVTFSRNLGGALIIQEGYTDTTLAERATGSGFRYAESGAEFQGRLALAHWTRPGAAETLCRVQQAP